MRDLELKALLHDALSDQLDDLTLLARGVDASYAYEGHAAYRAEELVQEDIASGGHED